MSLIHSTAVIDAKAELDSSVKVGPYTIIGPNVQIGAGSEIGPHTVIDGHTTIGENNKIFQFASLGAQPQDKKYRNEPTRLIIGVTMPNSLMLSANTDSVSSSTT